MKLWPKVLPPRRLCRTIERAIHSCVPLHRTCSSRLRGSARRRELTTPSSCTVITRLSSTPWRGTGVIRGSSGGDPAGHGWRVCLTFVMVDGPYLQLGEYCQYVLFSWNITSIPPYADLMPVLSGACAKYVSCASTAVDILGLYTQGKVRREVTSPTLLQLADDDDRLPFAFSGASFQCLTRSACCPMEQIAASWPCCSLKHRSVFAFRS